MKENCKKKTTTTNKDRKEQGEQRPQSNIKSKPIKNAYPPF